MNDEIGLFVERFTWSRKQLGDDLSSKSTTTSIALGEISIKYSVEETTEASASIAGPSSFLARSYNFEQVNPADDIQEGDVLIGKTISLIVSQVNRFPNSTSGIVYAI